MMVMKCKVENTIMISERPPLKDVDENVSACPCPGNYKPSGILTNTISVTCLTIFIFLKSYQKDQWLDIQTTKSNAIGH